MLRQFLRMLFGLVASLFCCTVFTTGCLKQVVDSEDAESVGPVTPQERQLRDLAMEALGQGNRKTEQQAWHRLSTSYPRSRYVPEAHRRLGLIAFEQKQWPEAILHLQQTQKYRLSPSVRSYVQVHLARAYLAQAQCDQAVPLLSHSYHQLPEKQQTQILRMLVRCAKDSKQPLQVLRWKTRWWESLPRGKRKDQLRRDILTIIQQLPIASLRQMVISDVVQQSITTISPPHTSPPHTSPPHTSTTSKPWLFPLDYAAYRLAELHYQQEQYQAAVPWLARLTQQITMQHPLYAEVQRMYAEVKETRGPAKLHTLGAILPLTGKFALIGNVIRQGIELALQDYPQVRVIFRDSMSRPEQAVAAVNDLVLREHVLAIFGPPMPQTAVAAGRRAQQLEVPMFSITAHENFPKMGSYLFRNNLTPAMMGRAVARYAFDVLRIRRLAILYPASAYGKTQARAFLEESRKLGAVMNGAMEYDPDAQDFMFPVKMLIGTVFANAHLLKIQREKIKKMKPFEQVRLRKKIEKMLQPLVPFEGLFVAAPALVASQIAAHLAYYNVGLKRPVMATGFDMSMMSEQEQFRKIQLLGNQDWYHKDVFQAGEVHVRGGLFCTRYVRESYRPASQQFTQAYVRQFKADPLPISAYAYDTMRILASIAAKRQIRTRIRFRQALLAIKDFDGPTGPMHIDAQGETHAPIKFVMTYRGQFRLHGELKIP